MSELHHFNGIDADTGQDLLRPLSDQELVDLVRREREPQTFLERLADWIKKFGIDDARRKPVVDTDRPWDLSETGWGVVFGPKVDRTTRLYFDELIEHRRDQVGRGKPDYVRICEYREGEATYDFLLRNGANPTMAADPDRLPFYLLLVGDPESLPFQFQYELDVQYAVGRLCFDTPEEYRSYVKKLIAAEGKAPGLPRRRTFFGARNEGDETTQTTTDELVEPLTGSIVEPGSGWDVQKVVAKDARKDRLIRLMGGDETPSVLFTASHGVRFEKDDPRQLERQGALVCQDWKRSDGGPRDSQYFSAADLKNEANVHGMIAFLFACHSAGSPDRDNFADGTSLGRPRKIAQRAFVSSLPKKLLTHPNGGVLAVVGHIDRAWTSSFKGSPAGEGCDVFRHCLQRLLQGHTIGWAMQHFNQAYSTLTSQLDPLWQGIQRREPVDYARLARYWTMSNDARNFILLGDPAVRVPGVREPGSAWRR
jgi:hypothetical protein